MKTCCVLHNILHDYDKMGEWVDLARAEEDGLFNEVEDYMDVTKAVFSLHVSRAQTQLLKNLDLTGRNRGVSVILHPVVSGCNLSVRQRCCGQ